ncbi:PadR family transcriptional regulator [candidate division KSB1 bacterium]
MSKTALAILGLLSERPMHGYEIRQTIKERWMDMWANVSMPSIYNTLNRLSADEHIKEEERKEKIGKIPQRYIYSLTDSGKLYLKELVEKGMVEGATNPHIKGTFWLSLVFVQYASPEIAKNALDKMIKSLANSLESLKENQKEAEKYENEIPIQWFAIMYAGIDSMKTEIKHLQYVLDNFDKTCRGMNQ